MSFALIYITHPSEAEAQRISHHLLEQKLVACANIFPIRSAYWWQHAIQNDAEWVSIVKTTLEKYNAVRMEVEAMHTYEVPCILKIEVEGFKMKILASYQRQKESCA